MERNLSDQKLSLWSAVAVLNNMFLTQSLSPYPLFSASSTVVGTCPGCKEQNKREGGRERNGGGGGERKGERERAVIFTGTVYWENVRIRGLWYSKHSLTPAVFGLAQRFDLNPQAFLRRLSGKPTIEEIISVLAARWCVQWTMYT